MAEWIYFLHPPREDFAATMTDEERVVWAAHFERLQRLLQDGVLILAGPTLGRINTGIAVIEAPDEPSARRIMEDDRRFAAGSPPGSCGRFASRSCGGARGRAGPRRRPPPQARCREEPGGGPPRGQLPWAMLQIVQYCVRSLRGCSRTVRIAKAMSSGRR